MNGVEGSSVTDVAFWVVSAIAIAASIMVVTLRDIFRAALFLALSFLAVAGLYILLRAEFLAVVQILVYVGAISILIVFAIVLVRDMPGGGKDNHLKVVAATVAALLGALAIFVSYNSDFTNLDALESSNADVAAALTGTYDLDASNAVGDEYEDQIAVAPPEGAEGTEIGIFSNSTGSIGGLFIRDFVLPFEAVSVLLLAAMIGALALLRQRGEES
ncbi:MAG: NADH-quinone oxidoreductase subunit J [Chloroflexi bacterium]|nr:NADH-quinone oxidoreductase subunit J [Chloroflexota bacterium]